MHEMRFKTQEQALDFLDDYAEARKDEIDRRQLGKNTGLIKSYMLETSPVSSSHSLDNNYVEKVLCGTGWNLTQIGENGFYRANNSEGFLGFIETISARHLVLHTFLETRQMDVVMRNTIKESAQLDSVWLAGSYLNLLWEFLIRERMLDRFVTFKFEHESRFEDRRWDEQDENDLRLDEDLDETDEDVEILERRASTLSISARVHKISHILPNLQDVLPDFKAIKMLRFPAPEMRGGYDFWDWGKITYRAPSFRAGRAYLSSILDLYQQTTELIEQLAWFQAEQTQLRDGADTISFSGTPVSFIFPQSLELFTFRNFVEITFEKGQGPFRLWGNPIWLSKNKVHVYGMDLHLWQRIYLELTPARFVIILPQGTCGNTVHRLISNIQRYLSPEVQAYIGDYPYEDLVRDVFLGKVKPA